MAGFQFVHIECYGRTAGKGKAGGRTVRSVVEEAERKPEACPHVDSPKQPTVVHGMKPSEAAAVAEERAAGAVDAKGRKMRADGLCLLAGVASFPSTVEECKADPAKMAAYRAWEKDAVAHLRATYGDCLKSVVRHTDEAHPHLHFYVVPELAQDGRMSMDSIHPGRAAASVVKAAGGVKGEQNRAYKDAMRQFQHAYFEAVGMKHGQARIGPGRRRMSREGWKAEQAAVESMSTALESAKAEEVAKVKQSAAAYRDRVIAAARAEAAKITAPARKLGGWIQATLDSMLGTRAKLEKEAKVEVEQVREEFAAKESRLWEKVDYHRGEAKRLGVEVAKVERLKDQSQELAQARAEVARLTNLLNPPKAPVPKAPSESMPAASSPRM